MILAALLLVQAASATLATDPAAIAQRLDTNWAGKLRSGKAGAQCKVTRSTGDAAIDRIGCSAMEACMPGYQSRLASTDDRSIRPEVKRVMQSALNAELATCMSRERATGIAALVATRGTQ